MPEGKAFAVVKGDGRAVQGPCLVTDIIFYCADNNDKVLVYDGLDATSGRFFCRIRGAGNRTYHIDLGDGVEFSSGVYVDQNDVEDETTICFRSLGE